MEQVIIWTVVLGTGVFAIGLVSAVSSRKRTQQQRSRERVWGEVAEIQKRKSKEASSAAAMAAGGDGNRGTVREEDFCDVQR